MTLNLAFPTLPSPLDSDERKRLTRTAAEWSPKGNNGEVLGRVFERLVRAFEFDWAWTTFASISRGDTKTGKFTDHLPTIGEIVGEHASIERLTAVYSLIEECLSKGWRLHAAVPAVSWGMARRHDALQWIPILRSLSRRIDRQYLHAQIEEALVRLVPFENSAVFPHATTEYLTGMVGMLVDESRVEKWTSDIENRGAAVQEYERRLDLVHEAIQIAREADHPGAPFGEVVLSLIRLGHCAAIEAVVRELQQFPCGQQTLFLRYLRTNDRFDLQRMNNEAAIRALSEITLSEGVKPDWEISHIFEHVSVAAIRLGLLAWWIDCADRYIQRFIAAGQQPHLTERLISIAARMSDPAFAHCPSDFWRSLADIAPTAELRALILAKLAVK